MLLQKPVYYAAAGNQIINGMDCLYIIYVDLPTYLIGQVAGPKNLFYLLGVYWDLHLQLLVGTHINLYIPQKCTAQQRLLNQFRSLIGRI